MSIIYLEIPKIIGGAYKIVISDTVGSRFYNTHGIQKKFMFEEQHRV